MSAVAQLLLKRDSLAITGCDLKENELIYELRKAGIVVWIGHDIQHLEGVDTVVYSSAITNDNPEVQEARRRGIQLMKRAELLAHLMEDKIVVTVTGMHGKTTTTSLAAHLLTEAGLLPTIAVGGILQNFGGNALMGEGRFFVAEADESDGSFLNYHPDYSIITNIDHEHLDYYQDFNKILEAFRCFINQTNDEGCLFCWGDDPYLRGLLLDYKKRVLFYGLNENADIYASNINLYGLNSEFDCFLGRELVGSFKIPIGGKHNILNTLSVIALGLELGIDKELIKAALVRYQGTRRRLEIKFRSEAISVLDDYGHHPTEIKATLEAVRLLNPRRLLVIFQPHRYTRTKLLLDSFATCFDLADYVIITDIYPAGEIPIEGVSGYSIYERLRLRRDPDRLKFLSKENIPEHVINILNSTPDKINQDYRTFHSRHNSQDVVLVLGAGDITKVSDELAEVFTRKA